MNPISHKDLVEPGNPFEDAIKGAQQLTVEVEKAVNKIREDMKTLSGQVGSTGINTKSGQQQVKELSDQIARQAAQYKTLQTQLAAVTSQINKMKDAAKQYDDLQKKAGQQEKITIDKSTLAYKNALMHKKLLDVETNAHNGSVQKLKATYGRLVFEMNTWHKVGSAAYNKLQAEAAQYNAQLKRIAAQHGVFGRNVWNYISAIRNAWMGVTVAMAGTFYAAKRWVMMNADLSDSMAAVRRTTGMTQKEVYALNETLRTFDTRTSQASLLDLAHVAGKLGIAKNEIAGFVKAADMIGVALGKDIGNNEEAINQLGRIVTIFNVSDNGVGMEKGLLKVGSALKDLGNASVAEEINIIDFTKRLGGLSSVAGVSIDKIMGLGATMDILGQTMEVSSTAVSQIWIGMAQKTEKFAKIAGMSVKNFSELMRRDFNEAFIAVALGLQKSGGGIFEVAEQFEGLSIDGRRLLNAMAVLSENISILRQQTDIAKKSLDAGTTAAKQFAIQNETLAAAINKATKAFTNFLANSGTLSIMTTVIKFLADNFERIAYSILSTITPVLTVFSLLNKIPSAKEGTAINIGKTEGDLSKLKQTLLDYENIWGKDGSNTQGVIGGTVAFAKIKSLKTQIALTEWLLRIEALRKKNDEYIKNAPKDLKDYNPDGTKKSPLQKEIDKQLAKQLKEQQKEYEAYYQFLLKLGTLTVDQIVEHERNVLIESGVWKRANEKERIEWEKKARIDATELVNKETLNVLELYYNDLIGAARRNNEDTYNLEREKLIALSNLWGEESSEYAKIKQQILDLDAKHIKESTAIYKKYYDDLNELQKDNSKRNIDNKLADNELAIDRIKNKKVNGKDGNIGVNLTNEDIAELRRLYQEKSDIIDQAANEEIRILQKQVESIDLWERVWMAMFGYISPEMEAMMIAQRERLNSQITGVQIKAEGDKSSGDKDIMGNLPERPFDALFKPEQWQEDLQKILGVVQQFVGSVSNLLSSLSQLYRQQQEEELAIVQARYEGEYEALDDAVKNKTMSEKEAARKKTDLERKQKAEQLKIEKEYRKKQQDMAIIQAIINVAMGVTQAFASLPLPLAILASIVVAAAGAAEIATISSQKFAKGGSGEINNKGITLKGKRHSQGGIQIPGIGEAEDGEYFAIINRQATARHKDELPELIGAINDGRVAQLFDKRGVVSPVIVNAQYPYGKEMLAEMRKKEPRIYQEGSFTVYETGNYRLKTSKQ